MKIVKYINVLFILLFIIFEEIVWKKIGEPSYNYVKSFNVMNSFKLWVSNLKNRYFLLFLFLLPFVLMEVSSLYAIKAIVLGSYITGVFLYTIKILLTVPVVIIFNVGKNILLTFVIIKISYFYILKFKRSKLFKSVKLSIQHVKTLLKDRQR